MARPTRRPGNLPAEAASFIGRRRELAEIRKKLAEARLVSLVGPGGVARPGWRSGRRPTSGADSATADGWSNWRRS
jgi:hypothetical protein